MIFTCLTCYFTGLGQNIILKIFWDIRMCLNFMAIIVSILWHAVLSGLFPVKTLALGSQTLFVDLWGMLQAYFFFLSICGFLRSCKQLEWEEWELLVGCLLYFVMWILVTSICIFVIFCCSYGVILENAQITWNITAATLSVWTSKDKQINRTWSTTFCASLTSGVGVSRQHTKGWPHWPPHLHQSWEVVPGPEIAGLALDTIPHFCSAMSLRAM